MMPFVSLTYLLFVLVTLLLFLIIPGRLRLWLLLIVSLCFYLLADPIHLPLLVVVSITSHFIVIRIKASPNKWLFVGIGLTLGSLLFFKYSHLFLELFHMPKTILMPLGISFYTFHLLSYFLDVYRGVIPSEGRLKFFLLYVMFWPQLLAGPILRAKEVLPQIEQLRTISSVDFAGGVINIIKGLFLKVVLADQLAPYIDKAFATPPGDLGGVDVLAMAFGFGLQIYFDFAGYSYIAIGTAALFGVTFPSNFDWPYLATSPKEFWQRWHITLSSWVRDYIYLPLLGLRIFNTSKGGLNIEALEGENSRFHRSAVLILTWVVMGVWHGGTLNFVLWGVWHAGLIGGYRAVRNSNLISKVPRPLMNFLGWLFTMLGVMLGWILFRAQTLSVAQGLLFRLADFKSYSHLSFDTNFYVLLAIIISMMVMLGGVRQYDGRLSHGLPKAIAEILVLTTMTASVFIFIQPIRQFIYFSF